jgi:hypothetical protein
MKPGMACNQQQQQALKRIKTTTIGNIASEFDLLLILLFVSMNFLSKKK